MTLPVEGIGVGVVSGGAVVAFVMKMLPILMRKFNGKKYNNRNDVKPGYAKTCIDRGLKIKEFDMAIVGLCGSVERIDKALELAHTENRQDFQRIFDKIDGLNS